MATAKTTKKTKKTTEKTTKAKKVGRPRTKKVKPENVEAVVDEFLNETAVETVEVKTERTVESVTFDATLQDDGTVVSGSISKEQIDDLLENGVCVDHGEEVCEDALEAIANEVNQQIMEQVIPEYANNAFSNPETEAEVPDVEEIILKVDEDIVRDTQEKPIENKPKPKPKKRLTNRDVFGYDFMGVIYEY